MIAHQNAKWVAKANAATANNGTHTMSVDTIDYDYCTIAVLAASAADTAAGLVLKVTEGTDTNCADAIVALTGTTNTVTSTSAGFCIPTQRSTASALGIPVAVFNIDLRGRKRYIACSYTPGTTAWVAQTAFLTRGVSMLSGTNQGADSVICG